MELDGIEGTVSINGANIWYKAAGTGPIIMVQPPGWGIGSQVYRDTLADLAQRYTIVFHDPRGSGFSDDANVEYSKVNVGEFANDLEALRRHLNIEKFFLLGHSHGGYIALNFALKYPGKLEGLILVDPQLGVEEPGEDLLRSLPRLATMPAYQAAVATFTGPRDLENDSDLSTFLMKIGALYFRDPAGPGFAKFLHFLENNRIALATFLASSSTDMHFTVRHLLSQIHVPTLAMVGEHDFICSPAQSDAIANAIQGAETIRFLESGHFCWIEEPQRFREVLKTFVDQHSRVTG